MPNELYVYGFGEDWERGDADFPSVEEALADAQKKGDGYETVNIGRQEVFEFRVDGNAVLDKIDDDVDAEGIEVDFFWNMDLLKEDIDDLSEMLTQTFRAWADKHGCAKFVEYITDVKKYDLATGRQV
jgi:hypothetical protein